MGPNAYDVDKPDPGVQYSFGLRTEQKVISCAPAPGTYDPEKAARLLDGSSAYSFGLRPEQKVKSDAPAPGTYNVDVSEPGVQYSFGLRPENKVGSVAPAPGTYDPEKADKINNIKPAYSFGL